MLIIRILLFEVAFDYNLKLVILATTSIILHKNFSPILQIFRHTLASLKAVRIINFAIVLSLCDLFPSFVNHFVFFLLMSMWATQDIWLIFKHILREFYIFVFHQIPNGTSLFCFRQDPMYNEHILIELIINSVLKTLI